MQKSGPIRGLKDVAAEVLLSHLPRSERGDLAEFVFEAGDATGMAGDAYRWRNIDKGVHFEGAGERGLLNAVHAWLEALGFLWPHAGERWTVRPADPDPPFPPDCEWVKPAFAGRCLILGHHAFVAEAEDWIHWAARNRLNTVFIHVDEHGWALGAAPMKQWLAIRERVMALVQRYGMTLELGGHGLTHLLPRSLFAEKPELFRMANGARVGDHNLCVSSAEALSIVRDNAAAWFRQHPGIDVYHLWAADLPSGGWCSCPACKGLTPSDQAMIATNAMAAALAEIAPDAELAHLAYHDTEEAPSVAPRRNVCALWAPRLRSYAEPIAGAMLRANGPYRAKIEKLVAAFAKAGARPLRVFEYYADGILYKGLLPPLADIIWGDAKAYAEAGVHTLQVLMTGDRPWNAPQLNLFIFAKACWSQRFDEDEIDAVTAQFARLAGGDGDRLASAFRWLEIAFRFALRITPREMTLGQTQGLDRLIADPPSDIGDPWASDRRLIDAKRRQLPQLRRALDRAMRDFEMSLRARDVDKGAREAFAAEFELARLWLDFHGSRLELYAAVKSNGHAPILPSLERAEGILQSIDSWADRHIESAIYRDNFKFMRFLFWGMRLGRIRADADPAHESILRDEALTRFARATALWNES